MKIVCEREKLLAAFSTAAPVVPGRTTKPVLMNVKLECRGEQATMLASDTELSIRASVEGVRVEDPGAALLPSARLGSILRECNDDELTISVTGTEVVVKGRRSNFRLPSADPVEFPVVPDFTETKYHTIDASALKALIRRTAFATDADVHRYALGGVLLEFQPKKIIAVGTDGRRMAVAEMGAEAVEEHVVGEGSTIVPTRATTVIERALADGDGLVSVAIHGNSIVVHSSRITLTARLLEGRFPKWQEVFPKQATVHKLDIPTGPLFSAVRQAAIVSTTDARGIDFHFQPGQLVVKGRSADYGESQVDLPVAYDGPEIPIRLDNRFLAEFLRVLDAEKNLSLALIDGDSAAVFSTEDHYQYVIMPLARDEG